MGINVERGGRVPRIFRGGPGSALLIAVLVGCWLLPAPAAAFFWPFSSRQQQVEEPPAPLPPPAAPQVQVNEALALARQISLIGDELFAGLKELNEEYGGLGEGVIVLSFVDQKQLTRTTSFGRYLAEQLMNELQRQQVPVVELRKSNAVRIRERGGEYGLSRDPAEIRERVAAGAMLTGTYTTTARQVMVNARIIDNRSAVLLASATVVIPRTAVVNDLLSDPVSGIPVGSEPMYMKRLEL